MSDKQVQIRITGDASSLSKAADQGAKDIEKLGISAKQTAAAMRGVPAQFTDIFVSLQGGQSPMQVFFQQGGQLKDMFGGTGAAAKALSSYILGMVSPLTVAAAAATGLGAAFYYGSEQSDRLQNALIMSGNAAGKTLGQMDSLAESVGRATGEYTLARDATEQLAASGKISANNINSALNGVVAGVTVTGQKTEQLVSDFEAIGKDPVAAIKKLNESYNFLTADIYKQIVALEKQGKHQEAVTLATDTFANTLQTRSKEVLANLGYIERGWLAITSAIGGAKDAALDFGRTKTLSDQIKETEEQLRQLTVGRIAGRAGVIKGTADQIADTQAKLDSLKADLARTESRAAAIGQKAADNKTQISAIDEANKNKKLGGTKTPEDDSSQYFANEMRDVASLSEAIIKLNEVEGTQAEQLQKKLNAYTNLDPELRKYLQGQIDIARANEISVKSEKEHQKALWETANASFEQTKADAQIAEEKQQTFQDMAEKLQKENEDLNIGLIANDKERIKAQIDLEHQRSVDRIAALGLEGEQAQQLIDQEAEHYRLQLKGIEADSRKTKTISEELGQTFKSSFEDAVLSGEKFSDMLKGLEKDIAKMLLRRYVTDPISKAIGGIVDSVFGGGSGGNSLGYDLLPDFVAANAKGGVYSGAGISAYSSSIVTSPTLFPFAKGTGLMGEAGPEGILPLKRGKDGKLGVTSDGAGSNVTVNVINNSSNTKAETQQSIDSRGNKSIEVMISDMVAAEVARPGSSVHSSMQSTFGARTALVRR